MKKIFFVIMGMICLLCGRVYADQWRIHPTFADYLVRIIDTPKYTYVLGRNQLYMDWAPEYSMITNSLFRYDKEEKETNPLNIQNLLSSPEVATAEYDFKNRFLMVTYTDGNIDMIYDDGKAVNIPGFKMTDGYVKGVNSITIDSDNNEAWLATNFGYVSVNTKKGEIATSRSFDGGGDAVASFNGKIFIGTKDGLFVTDKTNGSPIIPVGNLDNVTRFINTGNRLYIQAGSGIDASLSYIAKDDPENGIKPLVQTYITDVEPTKNGVIVNTPGEIWIYGDEKDSYYIKPVESHWKHMSGIDGRNFWLDRGAEGLVKLQGEPDNRDWKITSETILPNAANCYKATSMTYSPKYGMLVRNHGINFLFNNIDPVMPDYLSGLKDSEWTSLSATLRAPESAVFSVGHPNGVAIDPRDPDMLYCGSVKDGILRLNLNDPSKSLRLSRTTDPYMGKAGFVGIVEPLLSVPEYTPFGEPFFDNDGNLWSLYCNLNDKRSELWYWTPQARQATTSAANYQEMKKIVLKDFSYTIATAIRPLIHKANKNKIVAFIQVNKNNFAVYDHNGTLDNPDDDKMCKFSETLYDQDGSSIDFQNYTTVYEDPTNGNVWVGTNTGVFYFNPSTLSGTTNNKVTRVKVARNDGTNFADYLLDGVQVNVITADGQGRKWFGTNGGGVICTTPSGNEIVKVYTSDNSLLPNNMIYALCYNPANNSMMISTDSGLAELYLSSSSVESDDDQTAVVYPNPVRPDFYGYVSIEGLEDNALVKIMDSAGNLIKELGLASQGETRWDVTNLHNKRVRSGVYYVLASGSEEGSGFSTVAKILVVN
ncbi:MAG: hypothetical protein K2N05_09690 [Muribaculaceae bacterium]|nr:hypothetical protein [Muribaculaceae bacterium]